MARKLLAKSTPEVSLLEHIKDCHEILEIIKRLIPSIESVSTIDKKIWDLLFVAIIFHDLGKAHFEFQKLLHKVTNKWEYRRHEFYSIPFLSAYQIEDSLKEMLKLIVAGHHKGYNVLAEKYLTRYDNDDELLFDVSTKDDFKKDFEENVLVKPAIKLLANHFQISLEKEKIKPKNISTLIRLYIKTQPYKIDKANFFLPLLLFGGLKWCDQLGSAKIKKLPSLYPIDFNFLNEFKNSYYQHQIECNEILGNIILKAPTGAGKTESSLLWIRKQLVEFGQGRIFFVLPFTASINAMFERLGKNLNNENEWKVGMVHGKLDAYLYNYFDDYQYSISDRKEQIKSLRKKFKRTLIPFKITTPFQLLKHLFGLKGFEQGMFEMVGGYFIFDEIHAYSPVVAAQIKVLLEFVTKHLNAKVLIMTATMPSFLKSELIEAIGHFTPVTASKNLYNKFKRHKVKVLEGKLGDNLGLIKKALKTKKVLVVCNTVKQAQLVFKELKKGLKKEEATLLHSAFNGHDRYNKEQTLLNADKVKLLVGTQAIEVSLDIDYEVIFTEPAPIDALIQRFGRVNRDKSKWTERGLCECCVFSVNNDTDKYIYNMDIVKETIQQLRLIEPFNDGLIKEQKLQEVIDKVYPKWNKKDKKDFDNAYLELYARVKRISPMLHSDLDEEEFYSQFDGIKVLPEACYNIFKERIESLGFIGAEGYKVQIRRSNFIGWKQNGNLVSSSLAVGTEKGNIITIRFYRTNKKYTSDLGLIPYEEDNWQTFDVL